MKILNGVIFVTGRKNTGMKVLAMNPSACWVSAHYIFDYFGLLKANEEPQYTREVTIEDFEKMSEWIHCYVENDCEFHHFSLYLTDINVYLIQTYQDVIDKLTKLKFERTKFFQHLSQAIDGNVEAYKYVFDIPKEVEIPDEIGKSVLLIN